MFGTEGHNTSPPFISSLIGWMLLKEIRRHPEFKRCGMAYWQLYRNYLKHLLLEIARQDRAALLLWLPEGMACSQRDGIDARPPPEDAPEAACLFAHLQQRQKPASVCQREILRHAEALSRLARETRGGLILSARLRPLGYGATLCASPWKRSVLFAETDHSCEPRPAAAVIDENHGPAIDFVGANPGSIAFAIGPNRPVVAFTNKDPQNVYCWLNCLGKYPG